VSEQPEALRLADWLDADACDLQTPRLAAAELRRLHAVNAELLEALIDCRVALLTDSRSFAAIEKARAAIAKAEGVKPPRIEGYNTNRDQPTVTIKREVKP